MSLSVGIDVGGTFTDLVALAPDGTLTARKVLSTPGDQSTGVQAAVAALGSNDLSRIVHGTTVATNTLLERNGARVVLCATEGFTDLLWLRRQDRVSLYDLAADHTPPLVAPDDVVPVPERMAVDRVVLPLTRAAADEVARQVAAMAPEIVCVALLHAYRDPSHEQLLRDALRAAMPNVDVVLSSDVFPEIREYERTATACAEAYLRPRVAEYLRRLAARLEGDGFPAPGVMTSSGGMRSAGDAARAAALLALSGPAGGVVGAAAVARAAGVARALTIDIGGTSADVGLILDGAPLVEPGGAVASVPISLPRVLVETVSAGGGTIGWVDAGGALRVGPRSAGAIPGPAAFCHGGTLPTVTDAHVVLGHIAPGRMGSVTIDEGAARTAVSALAEQLGETVERVARAMIEIADAEMARALRRVSVERGIDPRGCALIAFGGGGPLHACGLAELLGMDRVIVPPFAGVLSALGLAMAAERRETMVSLTSDAAALDHGAIARLQETLARQVAAPRAVTSETWVRARYRGQGHELDVPVLAGDDGDAIALRFGTAHHARFGFTLDRPVELVSARHAASGEPLAVSLAAGRAESGVVAGPASVPLPDATMHVAEGWTATPMATGGFTLERSAPHHGAKIDALSLAVHANAFAMVAEEMGTVLVRGALSPNIRERRDASAALFDAEGRMVAQAAHIPVHLGAMPEAVRAVREHGPQAGDVFLLNDPYTGGSHLPDLTLVEAIDVDGAVGGFAAVRAHHADVGGMSPGSMPQGATELVQEGLIIPPVRLVRRGVLDEELLGLVLANVRTPGERRGDLRAQLAACAAGASGWRALRVREGADRVRAATDALIDYTARRAHALVSSLGAISGSATDWLEGDGVTDADIPVCIALTAVEGRLRLDFSGTSAIVAGNVNCPAAVTRAAAAFVLRTLMDDDVPTNDGLAQAIELVLPEGSAVNARWPAAVAAGNVEMSQRITDTIFAALAAAGVEVAAQGQGTMNNVTFGGAGWTFYETLGGGQGASRRGPGPSGVHVGMSNTLNTPIESLEAAYPLRIEAYSLRRDSGGAGVHRGGLGVVRQYQALAPCTVTLLTERRRHAPAGSAGGHAGEQGVNALNGVPIAAKLRMRLMVGDVLTIETPGGGGWGGAVRPVGFEKQA